MLSIIIALRFLFGGTAFAFVNTVFHDIFYFGERNFYVCNIVGEILYFSVYLPTVLLFYLFLSCLFLFSCLFILLNFPPSFSCRKFFDGLIILGSLY